jgi:hypothetical protein
MLVPAISISLSPVILANANQQSFLIPVLVMGKDKTIENINTQALIDSGAAGIFMDKAFANDEHGCAVHHGNAHSMHSRLTQNNAFCQSADNTLPTLALSTEAILLLGTPPSTSPTVSQGPADPPIATHLTI